MFEQLKRKRMMIEQSVSGKKNERENMSSAQRRRLVENDINQYNQMIKTMQNFRKTKTNNMSQQITNKTYNQESFKNISVPIEQIKPLMHTPTVKDINPSIQQSALAKQFYQLSPQQKNQSISISPEKNNNLINFYKQEAQQQKKPQISLPININSMQQNSSHRESQAQIEDEQIKFPKLLNSSKTQSNNNSQAIFFTSQFKQFLNNQVGSPRKPSPIKQQIKEQPLNHQAVLEQNKSNGKQVRIQRNLNNNASGQSLAISNDSSLKYSLNQSAIHDIINKKLSNQLVVQSVNRSQTKNINYFAQRLLIKENIKDFVEFGKMVQLCKFIRKRQLVSAIDRLMVNKEYKYQIRKEELQIHHMQQQRNQTLINNCFNFWLNIAKTKRESIEVLIAKKERQLKQKSFKTLKMLLFDRRINSQVDLYYLSKIFLAFRTVTQKQSKKQNQKAYRFYIKNLKKRMFHLFIQGCYNTRRQNQINQAAYNHYYYAILNRYFQSWKKLAPKEQKFIRLSMTTKNVLKETADRRLLQTKTFDFYQVK